MLLRPALLGLLLAASAAPPAALSEVRTAEGPCPSAVTTADMAACLGRAAKASDGQLNAAYGRILRALGPADRQRLVRAERLWLQYRDAQCAAERGLYDGGTAAGPAELACRDAETRGRLAALERAYGWKLDQSRK